MTTIHNGSKTSSIRWGLCCQFAEAPISFRNTTATALLKQPLNDRLRKVSELCRKNAESLLEALRYCAENSIGCFRVISSILPAKTHPEAGYRVQELPDGEDIIRLFQQCGAFAQQRNIRTVFHPDQFVVLNSQRDDVVQRSIEDLESHAEIADWVGADTINIHGGGAFGNKLNALGVLERNLDRLSIEARNRLTFENDDTVFTPADLLPVCRSSGIPLVYDVHHHRCLPDNQTIQEATEAALKTWNREPLFHLSSPRDGWAGPQPQRHHDLIDINDFPSEWHNLRITVEVEAKAKEIAVRQLRQQFAERFPTSHGNEAERSNVGKKGRPTQASISSKRTQP